MPDRQPGSGEISVKVGACGVCRTDLHVVDGVMAHPQVPIVPGHEIVGCIDAVGPNVWSLQIGQRVGIPSLTSTPMCAALSEGSHLEFGEYVLLYLGIGFQDGLSIQLREMQFAREAALGRYASAPPTKEMQARDPSTRHAPLSDGACR